MRTHAHKTFLDEWSSQYESVLRKVLKLKHMERQMTYFLYLYLPSNIKYSNGKQRCLAAERLKFIIGYTLYNLHNRFNSVIMIQQKQGTE